MGCGSREWAVCMGVKYVLLCARMSLLIINVEDRSCIGFCKFSSFLSHTPYCFIFSLRGFIFIYPVWVVWACVLYFCVGLNRVGGYSVPISYSSGWRLYPFFFSFSFFLSSSWFSLSLKHLTVMGSSSISLQRRSPFFSHVLGLVWWCCVLCEAIQSIFMHHAPPLPALPVFLLTCFLTGRPTYEFVFWDWGATSACFFELFGVAYCMPRVLDMS